MKLHSLDRGSTQCRANQKSKIWPPWSLTRLDTLQLLNEIWQEGRSAQCPVPNLCFPMFSGRSENQDGCPGLCMDEALWVILCNYWTEFDGTLQEAIAQWPLTFCFRLIKCNKPPFVTDPSTKIMVHSRFIVLRCTIVLVSAPEPKAQMHYCDHALSVVRRPSLTFHIFDFFSETAERNSTKLRKKQDLNVLYQDCVFRTDRKNKMAALASDWLRHFRLLLWNRWTEFNKTWQEARSQRPLPS